MKLNGSQIVLEVLLENGVDTVFGYPGGTVLNIYDALYSYSDKINHILTAHEQGAAHAADGYARATGKTGVVIATSGPGSTNLVTGIATAYMDSIPMVAITGNVNRSLVGRDSFQEVYISGITMPITKHNFVVRDVESLADTLREAFRIAGSGRPGPVLVDIPKDITAEECDFEPKTPEKTEIREPHFDENEIAALISAAKRPIIYFGGGVKLAGAGQKLLALMKKAQIPAAHTMMAAGVLRYDEPLNLGLIGMHGSVTANRAVNEADLVIAAGARFSDRVALNPEKFASKAKIIHIDVDRSELSKNVRADYRIRGDISAVLDIITPLIDAADHSEWLGQIGSWRTGDYRPVFDGRLTPHAVIDILNKKMPDDTIYATDVGQHQLWATQYLNHTDPKNFLTSGGLGTMGYGYGAALGAQAAYPDRRVVHITSDGSFHMNLNEACTAVSFDLPVISVIMNNEVLGMVRQWQTVFYGRRYSASQPQRVTDYVKVAEGFGAIGYIVTTPEEFEAALDAAVASGKPAWIDCRIDREERVLPMIPAGQTVDNIIVD